MSTQTRDSMAADRAFEQFLDAKGTSLSEDTIYQAKLAFQHLQEVNGTLSALDSIGPDDIHSLVRSLRSDGTSDATIEKYLSHLRNLYSFHQRRGNLESNPIEIAADEINFQSSSTDRRHIPLTEMRSFVCDLSNPHQEAIVVTLLKTGMRNGELCNLDLRDLNLDHEGFRSTYNIRPRQEIASRPNTLFVDNNIRSGQIVQGEERDAGNKRKIPTIIPIDEELRYVLLRYLAVRPDTSHLPANPLFVSTHGSPSRYTRDALSRLVARLAEENDWYNQGAGLSSNVTPHYFRHYFSSHNRDAFGEAVLKYIRGDVGGDIVDHYTHAWALQVKQTYVDNVYKFYD